MSSFTPVNGFSRWLRARSRSGQAPDDTTAGTHEVKVYKSGAIGVPTSTLRDIGARQRVALLYNKETRSVALIPAEDDDPESFAISRNGENNNLINGRRLLNAMGWLIPGMYPARVDGNMLIMDLREESIIR